MSGKVRKRRNGVLVPPTLDDIFTPPKISRMALEAVGATPAPPPETAQRVVNFALWSKDEVAKFLSDLGLPETVTETFKENEIEGRHLLDLSEHDLLQMGIKTIGIQKDILKALETFKDKKLFGISGEKIFNDPIHGHIELHPLMIKIIDTPQFQRLRYIKQLGGGYYVFPGASHNRFEHSIGVCHLAGELVELLQKKQPELGITAKDVLCVRIAGLCHDLGHGPFSHLFDGSFIPLVRPDSTWKHEEASVKMFDHLLRENNLWPEMEKYGLKEEDATFIKEQIAGPLESELCSQASDWLYSGRPESKSFLYEIVANKRNGIDVDKWDYFARDCYYLGIPNNFDTRRFMKFARVIDVNQRRQICTRDKEVTNLYEMFHTRSCLHRRAYQHKTANIIEHMFTEALVKANDYLLLPGTICPVKMSEAIHDMHAYTLLTDHIIQQIALSTDPNLEESRELLHKIEKRELYKCIGQTQAILHGRLKKTDGPKIAREIVSSLSPADLEGLPQLTVEDIVVHIVTFDYGMRSENPIDHMRFYRKDNFDKALKVEKHVVSQMLPQSFMEQYVRVYCKKLDHASLQATWKCFLNWCSKQGEDVTPKVLVSDDMDSDKDGIQETDITPYGTPLGTPVKQDSPLHTPVQQSSPYSEKGGRSKHYLKF